MESLTSNNINTDVNNPWDSLKNFGANNEEEYMRPQILMTPEGDLTPSYVIPEEYMLENGIILTGEAARNARRMNEMKALNYVENGSNRFEEVKPVGEDDAPYEEIAFVQSTDLADRLKNDPNYFTYLISSEHGFGVEKSRAVDACIDKMKSAEDNDQIWQAIRLGQDITNSHGEFSEEEKQRVREFMATPFARRKELAYRIASEEKALKRVEDGIQRCEREYNSLNSGNVVDKFFRRQEIINARTRLEATIKRKSDTLRTIKRQRAELQALGQGESEVA